MTKMVKPLILITNDDGISSPGIRVLIRQMKRLGDVVVVAPDSPQSGMSHAITISDSLRCEPIFMDSGPQREFSCSGTPADCIKIGVHEILEKKPDMIVSGINHGSNASVNVLYSGTMAAAIEGALQGVPSIGFSLLDYSWDADFSEAENYVYKIASMVLKKGMPNGVCLNANIPKISANRYKGIRVCRQTIGKWMEKFDTRVDPNGKSYAWMTGEFKDMDGSDETDIWALNNNYVTVVPIQFDLTSYKSIIDINKILEL